MKKMKVFIIRVLLFLSLFSIPDIISAQTLTNRPNVNINSNCNGYVEFLPASYNSNNKNYPLLIFLHGNSQWGPGTDSSLQIVRTLGPNYWVDVWLNPANWWLPFPGLNDLSKMVMISPQFIGPDTYSNPPNAWQIDEVIDYVCSHYRVDRSRIYMSGVSFGGRWAIEYAYWFPHRIAGVLPFAPATWAYQPWADTLAASNLPIWMINNLYDPIIGPQVAQLWISEINNPTPPIAPPNPLAVGTYPPIYGHWYDDTYRGLDTATNGMNMNMYQWMLQYSRANYFLGGAGSSWENAGNWSYKQVPNDTTVVIINRGPVIVNSNAYCKKLTLQPGVSLTVNSGYKLTVKQ